MRTLAPLPDARAAARRGGKVPMHWAGAHLYSVCTRERAPGARHVEGPRRQTAEHHNHAKASREMPLYKAPQCGAFLFMPPRFHNRRMDDIVRQAIAKWPNVPDCWA